MKIALLIPSFLPMNEGAKNGFLVPSQDLELFTEKVTV